MLYIFVGIFNINLLSGHERILTGWNRRNGTKSYHSRAHISTGHSFTPSPVHLYNSTEESFFLFGFWSAIGTSPSQPTPPLFLHFPPWLSSFLVPFSQLGPYAGHDDHHISFLLSYVTCWHYNVPRLAINTTRKKKKRNVIFLFTARGQGWQDIYSRRKWDILLPEQYIILQMIYRLI